MFNLKTHYPPTRHELCVGQASSSPPPSTHSIVHIGNMIGPKCMVLYTDTCNYVIFANRLPLYPCKSCKLLWTNQITKLVAFLIRSYKDHNMYLVYVFVIVVIIVQNIYIY